MVMFLVVRHTRAEEETGRAELLRSTVLGRHAATLAGLRLRRAAALLIGCITTGVDAGGRPRPPTAASPTAPDSPCSGVCYAAVTLVAAQLSTSARGALGTRRRRDRPRLPRPRGRRDAGQRAGVGLAVRLGPAHERLRRRALVAGPPAAGGHRRAARARRPSSPPAATSAAACWTPGPGRPRACRSAHAVRPGAATPARPADRMGHRPVRSRTALRRRHPHHPRPGRLQPRHRPRRRRLGDAEQALIDAFLRYIFLFMAVISTGFAVVARSCGCAPRRSPAAPRRCSPPRSAGRPGWQPPPCRLPRRQQSPSSWGSASPSVTGWAWASGTRSCHRSPDSCPTCPAPSSSPPSRSPCTASCPRDRSGVGGGRVRRAAGHAR